MNTPIRRLALVLFGLFAIIAFDLTYVQVIAGPRYRDDSRNQRVLTSRSQRERGPILSREGVVLAQSEEIPGTTEAFDRTYPEGALYAHAVGFSSLLFDRTGLEEARSNQLRSDRNLTITGILDSLLGRQTGARGIRTTLSHPVQMAAAEGLGSQPGAIVAIDPTTGEVLALYSSPSFDPARLLGDDPAGGDALAADPSLPLLDRTRRQTYAPGSTFKTITTAAAIDSGAANAQTTFPDPVALELPGTTATIRNFDREPCGNGIEVSLATAFRRSCNTTFGQIGLTLGAEALVARAADFGFGEEVPFDLGVVVSTLPPAADLDADPPALAQTAIGERDVRVTPLQMALVAAAVANDGQVMTPYLVAETFDRDLAVIERTEPIIWRRAVSPGTATVLADLMEAAVTSGTGTRAAIEGARVGGKTGTTEVPEGAPHAWFIGFAATPERRIALAVLVESGGNAGVNATGGSVAAPIARGVMLAWLQTP